MRHPAIVTFERLSESLHSASIEGCLTSVESASVPRTPGSAGASSEAVHSASVVVNGKRVLWVVAAAVPTWSDTAVQELLAMTDSVLDWSFDGRARCLCVRTWWSIPDVQKNYGDFNRLRLGEYVQRGWQPGKPLPASTCVGSPGSAILVAIAVDRDEWSLESMSTDDIVTQPRAYGFFYDRVLTLRSREVEFLIVSATAAMDRSGKVLGSTLAEQFDVSMSTLEALARRCGFHFGHAESIVAYASTGDVIEGARCLNRGLTRSLKGRFSATEATICREDVQVEIEALFRRHISTEEHGAVKDTHTGDRRS